jgi:exopolyphosphatase/guanosine-5'-triphosphate,3'-diphosphate pyrophosphatase
MESSGPTSLATFAAIDVGTNAVRLKLARRAPGGEATALHAQRDPVRPGDGVFTAGAMSADAINRLLQTLFEYRELCLHYRARVRAVATSALREASNREQILERVRRHCGLDLEVISGREEARLVCLGVLAGMPPRTRSLCIDLGGGSTEIALARGEHPIALHSLQLGSARLEQQVGGDLQSMRALAASAVALLPSQLAGSAGISAALGCSGSIRALVDFATNGQRTSATVVELGAAVEAIARMSPAVRAAIFESRRAEIILPAAVILEAVTLKLGVSAVEATKRGLRDGILLEMMAKEARPAPAAPSRAAAPPAVEPDAA